jgi:acyl carrier protein
MSETAFTAPARARERSEIRAEVLRLVASRAKVDPGALRPEDDLRDGLGLRSLDVLVLSELVERTFHISISDEDAARLMTVGALADFVVERAAPKPDPVRSGAAAPSGTELREDGALESDFEISMQLLGMNGLSETPLIAKMLDLRWQHMTALSGVRTRDIVDEAGERLYAAVFFVETRFPNARALGTFGENDRVSVVSTLARFGTTLLDGRHYVFPYEAPASSKVPPRDDTDALARGIPWVRISNTFVKKWDGGGWLKKSRPAAPGFTRIPQIAEPPSSYEECTTIRERGHAFDVPPSYVPLTPEPVTVEYPIVPDRDMNGVGLLYFAVYPTIMDVAERRVLASAGPLALEPELIDRRTLVHRKIAYFSNADANDTLEVSLRVFVENPFLAGVADPAMAPIRLHEEIRIHRRSDQRLMAISGARKVILGHTLGDSRLLSALGEKH